MGTDVYSSLGSILKQLETAKVGLQKIDEHIKKVVQTSGRFQNDRNNERNFQNTSNNRGTPRLGGRGNFYQDSPNNRNFDDDRQSRKRPPQETKTVFSRLSARPGGDSDGEDEAFSGKKPRISSQVIRDLPTKQQVLKAQTGDEVSKARNRRMFGSLLGTLQKFKQEEIILKNKEDKKAQVEKKIEEQAKQELENRKKERQHLFAEREIKKATIKALESKMIRMQVYEKWEETQKPLSSFIQTRAKPHVFWLPKKMTTEAHEKHDISRKKHEKYLEKKREDLKLELDGIEQRCLRNAKLPPGTRSRPSTISQASEDAENDIPMYQNTSVLDVDVSQDLDTSRDERVTSSSTINIKKEEDQEKKSGSKGGDVKPNVKDIKLEGQRRRQNGDTTPERRNHSDDDDDDDSSSEDDDNADGSKEQSGDDDSQTAGDNNEDEADEICPNAQPKKEKEEKTEQVPEKHTREPDKEAKK